MQHRTMTDGHIVLEYERAFVPHHMADRTILDVRMCANADNVHISAYNAVVPNTGMIADFHITDDLGAICDVNPLSQLRPFALVFMQHRQLPDKTSKVTEPL
jgi:hypothetical protein